MTFVESTGGLGLNAQLDMLVLTRCSVTAAQQLIFHSHRPASFSRSVVFCELQYEKQRSSRSTASGQNFGGAARVSVVHVQALHRRSDDESHYEREVTQASLDTDSEDDRLPDFSESVVATSNDHADKCEAVRGGRSRGDALSCGSCLRS